MPIEIVAGPVVARKVVAHSKNLRGILTYARKHGVTYARSQRRSDGSSSVYVRFGDKAECRTEFTSHAVAIGFFRARRSWGLSECYCSDDLTSFVTLP